MSKISREVKGQRKATTEKSVVNYMGGVSFELNPLDTLKMVTASSIFGEPQYYRDGEFAEKGIAKDASFSIDSCFAPFILPEMKKYKGMKTSNLMEKVIDDALRYDFKATLDWAITLRTEFNMRLNPQIIMVRAAIMKEERIAFNKANPTVFIKINNEVMSRCDDVISQVTYYLYLNGSKANIPNILKKSWAYNIENRSRYELNKYKNKGIGMIDTVRICHAHNEDIDELMTNSTLEMPDEAKTWESLKASGDNWTTILNKINMPHMALLRNLRGIFTEISDYDTCQEIMKKLVKGVEKGKQFPFRYMSASNAVEYAKDVNNKALILDELESCLDKACNNLPHLAGNNAFLSDNSGSAWGACTSEYGTVKVAEIGNLSATIGAANSDKGTVVLFGDRMIKKEISKRQGILAQAKDITKDARRNVGGATENGVWLFFDEAITKNIVYDNIFIYSDMQAGHGGLYGTESSIVKYNAEGYAVRGRYIDVAKLVETYRNKVNPKVNVYCIQTAGYNNVLVPENGYRTNILYGWTGKELVYADMMNKFWDEIDARKNTKEVAS